MKRIAPWLLPTIIGPMIGAALYVLVASSIADLPVKIPSWVWVIAALTASGLSLLIGLMMAVTDVALLKLELRMPPSGWRAWAMGIAAPLPILFLWQKLVRFAITGLPQFLLVVLLPMLGVALALRLFATARPESWDKG